MQGLTGFGESKGKIQRGVCSSPEAPDYKRVAERAYVFMSFQVDF